MSDSRAALITPADLAAACRRVPGGVGPVELIATPTIETVIAIAAAIERARPLILHHPRSTAEQRARRAVAIRDRPLPADTLAVVFTSGSTGEPRPIALGRRTAYAAAAASAAHLGWRDDDAWLLCLPLAHVGGLAIIVRCLIARRPIVLASPFDPIAEVATLASWVPTQLADILDRDRRLPRLRAVLLGGAPCPRTLRAAASARGLPILTTYGMTETWGQVATQPLARAGHVDDGVGVPLPGTTITAGTSTSPARITITSSQLSSDRLITDDLGFLDERGWLHVIGRADDVIITGGEKVHPAVVEDALAGAPGVRAACVFGVPDPRWGERVVAAVELAPDADLAALSAHASAHLASHERPREFRRVAHLPRTPSGKLDRRSARNLGD